LNIERISAEQIHTRLTCNKRELAAFGKDANLLAGAGKRFRELSGTISGFGHNRGAAGVGENKLFFQNSIGNDLKFLQIRELLSRHDLRHGLNGAIQFFLISNISRVYSEVLANAGLIRSRHDFYRHIYCKRSVISAYRDLFAGHISDLKILG